MRKWCVRVVISYHFRAEMQQASGLKKAQGPTPAVAAQEKEAAVPEATQDALPKAAAGHF